LHRVEKKTVQLVQWAGWVSEATFGAPFDTSRPVRAPVRSRRALGHANDGAKLFSLADFKALSTTLRHLDGGFILSINDALKICSIFDGVD